MRPNAIGSFGAVAVTVRHRHTVWQAHVQCPASTSSAASASQHEPLGGRSFSCRTENMKEIERGRALRADINLGSRGPSPRRPRPTSPPSRPRCPFARRLAIGA